MVLVKLRKNEGKLESEAVVSSLVTVYFMYARLVANEWQLLGL